MKKVLFFAIAALMTACAPAIPTYTIVGEVAGEKNEGKEVYLTSVGTDKALDTVTIVDGKFSFTGDLHCPDIASLTISGIRYSPQFVLESGNITVKVGENGNTTFSGTPLNETLQTLNTEHTNTRNEFMKKFEELKVLYKDDEEKLKAEITRINNEVFSKPLEKLYKDAFEQNRTNILGMNLFMNPFVGSFNSLEKINEYIVEYPAVADYMPLKKTMEILTKEKNTSAGNMFTDFPARNIENTADVKLSDYVGKGEYVLLDFWANWCSPCRAEMPELAKLHKKYAKKGLTILSVNVWDTHSEALKGIKNMGMVWNQIYVPKAEGDATAAYGVQGIPTIILFAPDGTIAYRSHGGHEMIEFVEKTMNSK